MLFSIFSTWSSSAAIFSDQDALVSGLVMRVLLVNLTFPLVVSFSGKLQDMWTSLPQHKQTLTSIIFIFLRLVGCACAEDTSTNSGSETGAYIFGVSFMPLIVLPKDI